MDKKMIISTIFVFVCIGVVFYMAEINLKDIQDSFAVAPVTEDEVSCVPSGCCYPSSCVKSTDVSTGACCGILCTQAITPTVLNDGFGNAMGHCAYDATTDTCYVKPISCNNNDWVNDNTLADPIPAWAFDCGVDKVSCDYSNCAPKDTVCICKTCPELCGGKEVIEKTVVSGWFASVLPQTQATCESVTSVLMAPENELTCPEDCSPVTSGYCHDDSNCPDCYSCMSDQTGATFFDTSALCEASADDQCIVHVAGYCHDDSNCPDCYSCYDTDVSSTVDFFTTQLACGTSADAQCTMGWCHSTQINCPSCYECESSSTGVLYFTSQLTCGTSADSASYCYVPEEGYCHHDIDCPSECFACFDNQTDLMFYDDSVSCNSAVDLKLSTCNISEEVVWYYNEDWPCSITCLSENVIDYDTNADDKVYNTQTECESAADAFCAFDTPSNEAEEPAPFSVMSDIDSVIWVTALTAGFLVFYYYGRKI